MSENRTLPLSAARERMNEIKENLQETLKFIRDRSDLSLEFPDGETRALNLENIAAQASLASDNPMTKGQLFTFINLGSLGKARLDVLEETMRGFSVPEKVEGVMVSRPLWGASGDFPKFFKDLAPQILDSGGDEDDDE